MRLRLTRQAETDIEAILEQTLLEFGPMQVQRYSAIISTALDMIAEQPDRPTARMRPEIGPNVQAFHLAQAVERRSAAAHLVYFSKLQSGPEEEIVVLRLLHERMEPRRYLLKGLQAR
jgi:toxin ParE1/3/4